MLVLMSAFMLTLGAPQPAAAQGNGNLVINSVNLTSFAVVNGVLQAEGTVAGTLAGLPFTADIENFALDPIPNNPATPGNECAVLSLELGPINLALLGLFVDTSPICLEVTAFQGGGLLGDLLCALAGGPGAVAPAIPTGQNLTNLVALVQRVLNTALGGNPVRQHDGSDVCTGECEILDLVLGPLDLTLLGLNIRLDDCEDGPVQICVSASRGQGILGDLLCGLSRPRIPRLTLGEVTQLINRALALQPGGFTKNEIAQLRSFLNRLAQQ